jgi:DNA sulfur modification protein DndC
MTGIQDPDQALEDTARILNEQDYNPNWFFMFSGGKDSNATVQSAWVLVKEKRVPAPQSVTILFADTQMEFHQFLEEVDDKANILKNAWESLGVAARYVSVVPVIQSDFWVRLLGYGYAPPTKAMRWCTDQLKIQPARKMRNALNLNEALLMVGARYGESARRDEYLSCTMGGECGPDAMARVKSKFPTVLPIVNWRTCAVWDFLQLVAPSYGIDNSRLRAIYGPDGDLRYGCWSCPLVFNDRTAKHWAKTDPLTAELLTWTNANLRPGGAAWESVNRELFEGQEARLSLDYCRRLFAELIDMQNRHGRVLLKEWQITGIQAMWEWREQAPDAMRGVIAQSPLFDMQPQPTTVHISQIPVRSARLLSVAPLQEDAYHQAIQSHAQVLVKLSPAVTWNYLTQHGYGADSATTWTSGQGEIVRVYRNEITRFTV